MTFKTILVHAKSTPAAAPRTETAAAVARHFDATLTGLGAETSDLVGHGALSALAADELMSLMADRTQRDFKAAGDHFERHAASTCHTWLTPREPPAQAMARVGRAADLIVAGGAPLNHSDFHDTAHPADLVLLSGRPVLVAPPARS